MGKKKRNKSGQAGGSVAVATETKQVPGSRPQGFSVSAQSIPAFFSTRYFEWLALALASVVSYWILKARLVGVNVSVLVDEYSYVLDAHYRGLTEAIYPNYLFQLVYSGTRACGVDFYTCARDLNSLFVIASAAVLYFLATHLSGRRWLGAIVWAGAVYGSFGTYTAYFMPEAIFNFFMVLFFYALVRFGQSGQIVVWVFLGSILGVASLAKPHALFVVPALVIYTLLLTRATYSRPWVQSGKRIFLFIASILASKLGIGYLIAGTKALSLFGSYGGVTVDSNFVSSSASLVEDTLLAESTLQNIFVTSWGQTLMMTMILGISMAVSLASLAASWTKESDFFIANRLRILFAISLLNMMAVAALFEAWLGLTNWMHTRYSSYLIPLALIVLVEAYSNAKLGPSKSAKGVVVGIFVVLSSIALVTAAMPYGANWIDAPDFKSHIDNLALSSIAIVVAILLAVWWLWNHKTPMLIGLVFAGLAATGSGTYISGFLQQAFGQEIPSDQLGRILRDYLPQEELDKTVLVGDNNTAMQRSLFGALTGSAQIILAPESGFDFAQIPEDRLWLVKVGEPLISDLPSPTMTGAGYSLYSLSETNSLRPRSNQFSSSATTCASQDLTEWVCGSEGTVSAGASFPANSQLDLLVEFSSEVAAKDIRFSLGDSSLTGNFSAGIFAISMGFENSTQAEELKLEISGDSRNEFTDETQFFRIISLNRISK